MFIKVQLFWEGHKNLRDLPQGFDIYLVNVKTMRKIEQIFVFFSEKLNFNQMSPTLVSLIDFFWVLCTVDHRTKVLFFTHLLLQNKRIIFYLLKFSTYFFSFQVVPRANGQSSPIDSLSTVAKTPATGEPIWLIK